MDHSQLTPDQFNSMMTVAVNVWIFILAFALAIRLLAIWFFWRIFVRAGFTGAIALINIVPLGSIICVLILAFSEWPARRESLAVS
jgi:magnesium-transporting ATPase (P-type)